MQMELRVFSDVSGGMRKVDPRFVSQCRTEQDAYKLCINQSRVYRDQGSIADLLKMNRSVFCRAINGDRTERNHCLSRTNQIKLQQICGNYAIDQWAEMYARDDLNTCYETLEKVG